MTFGSSDPALTRPLSLLIAVVGTSVSGVAVLGVAIASVVSRNVLFGWGIGLVLSLYAALVLWGAWAGWRGRSFAMGLMLSPALLHLATAGSLLATPDQGQRVVAVAVAALSLVSVVATMWPSTVRALGRATNAGDRRPPRE